MDESADGLAVLDGAAVDGALLVMVGSSPNSYSSSTLAAPMDE